MERIMKEINRYILEKFKISKDIDNSSSLAKDIVSFFCGNNDIEKILNLVENFFNKHDITEAKDLKNILLEKYQGIEYRKLILPLKEINYDLFYCLKIYPHDDFIKYYKEVRHPEYKIYTYDGIYIYEKNNIMNICNTKDKFHYSLILEANEKN